MERSQENLPSQWGPVAVEGRSSAERTTETYSEGTDVHEAAESNLLQKATTAISDSIESAGAYVQDIDVGEAAERLAETIRRYPIQTLLIGAVIGFLLGRGRV